MSYYYGKYRGVVTNVSDPDGVGRIKANVPAINGEFETGWCLPCLPTPGVVILPKVGDTVWVEFERGKVEYPIWVGCWSPQSKPMTVGTNSFSESNISFGCGSADFSMDWVKQKIEECSTALKAYADQQDKSLKDYCNGTFKKY